MEEKKKLVRGWETPRGKFTYAMAALWMIIYYAGTIYFNTLEAPLVVFGWVPAVLIHQYALFFFGLWIGYSFYYKVGARKGM